MNLGMIRWKRELVNLKFFFLVYRVLKFFVMNKIYIRILFYELISNIYCFFYFMIFLLEVLYNISIVYFFCLELVIFNVELFCLNFMKSYFIFGLWGFSFIGLFI